MNFISVPYSKVKKIVYEMIASSDTSNNGEANTTVDMDAFNSTGADDTMETECLAVNTVNIASTPAESITLRYRLSFNDTSYAEASVLKLNKCRLPKPAVFHVRLF